MNATAPRSTNSFILFCLCLLSVLLSAPALAQQNPGITKSNGTNMSMNNPDQQEMQMREWNLTHIADEVNGHFKKDSIALFPQIREDFTQIQRVNNQTMQTVFIQKSIDYKMIAKAAAEINKRAVRLKDSLLLPKLDGKPDKPAFPTEQMNDDRLKQSLLQMDRALMSFVNSSLFKQPALVNPDSALKARRDLESVIQLSDVIEKTAKKMKDAPPHQ